MYMTDSNGNERREINIEQELKDTELRYRRLFESVQDGILILNAATGAISDLNPSLLEMLGYTRNELIGKRFCEAGPFQEIKASQNIFQNLQGDGFIRYENLQLKKKDGQLFPVGFVCHLYQLGGESVIQCHIRDESDRNRFEETMQAQEDDRLSLIENQENRLLLIERLPVGVILHSVDTRIVLCNSEAAQLLGIAASKLLGMAADNPSWSFLHEDGTRMPPEDYPVNQVISTREKIKNLVMGINGGPEEEVRWVLVNTYPEFADDELRQVIVMLTDISEIKAAKEKIQRQLEHLTALIEIDRAINFSFDLNLSLNTLLTHLIVQLKVDAADILLFDPALKTLAYVAGQGFHGKTIEHMSQPLGKGYAGRAAREWTLVHIPDLAREHDTFLRRTLLAGEEFVSYYGIPLIAKGKVMGVLEIFHRTRLDGDVAWLSFLKALAGQAAIAIDNATLFENLQHSNAELFEAYDATIEGWSRALDLRDNGTEGHTQRVAALTVQLARLFGLSDAELIQVRWGALLHDIGKMGIPDDILLKEKTLTEAEWFIMKKHTVFAYEMLSPIRYLRSALDIPHAHHEKWDGSGYPLGLKREQIPLVARIFAVADVWDALRSDRLYRTSWSATRVHNHILALSGSHFDPHVVEVCLSSGLLAE